MLLERVIIIIIIIIISNRSSAIIIIIIISQRASQSQKIIKIDTYKNDDDDIKIASFGESSKHHFTVGRTIIILYFIHDVLRTLLLLL